MTAYPILSTEERLALLEVPQGRSSMVLDTDAYNEIDDQFALAYALLSDQLDVEAVYASPFYSPRWPRSTDAADGMEKSYEEILRVLERLDRTHEDFAFRGSPGYLPSPTEPIRSPAAEDLIERALAKRDRPLYVVTIGAPTNVSSAILMEPEIIKHIVVVWLGGDPYYWTQPMTWCFNMVQDLAASRIIFDSGVPLVHIPCKNVAEHLRTTLAELEVFVKDRGLIGDYLYITYKEFMEQYPAMLSKVIWDINNVAYLIEPAWVPTILHPSPILLDDLTWGAPSPERHMAREAINVNRDDIFRDMFQKLEAHASVSRAAVSQEASG